MPLKKFWSVISAAVHKHPKLFSAYDSRSAKLFGWSGIICYTCLDNDNTSGKYHPKITPWMSMMMQGALTIGKGSAESGGYLLESSSSFMTLQPVDLAVSRSLYLITSHGTWTCMWLDWADVQSNSSEHAHFYSRMPLPPSWQSPRIHAQVACWVSEEGASKLHADRPEIG